jgi:acetyltransferase-like isoleucine patch superfamily enzyme
VIALYQRCFLSPLKYAQKIGVKIGKDCSIMTRFFSTEPYLIEIGDHVQITSNVHFFTHGAAWCLRLKNPDFDFFGKIKIGNNVYIGNNALIMPGVTIGNNVIVGAGSVITKSIADGMIVAGNPAKIVGTLFDFEKRMEKFNVNIKSLASLDKKKYLLSLSEDKFLKK